MVAVLAACQAALLTNNIIIVGLNGPVGYTLLGEDKSLATLPVTAYILGTACTTVPASFWMNRVGRRGGFITGATLGVIGALLGAFAVFSSNFWPFVRYPGPVHHGRDEKNAEHLILRILISVI